MTFSDGDFRCLNLIAASSHPIFAVVPKGTPHNNWSVLLHSAVLVILAVPLHGEVILSVPLLHELVLLLVLGSDQLGQKLGRLLGVAPARGALLQGQVSVSLFHFVKL